MLSQPLRLVSSESFGPTGSSTRKKTKDSLLPTRAYRVSVYLRTTKGYTCFTCFYQLTGYRAPRDDIDATNLIRDNGAVAASF
jgi:hypothetical protein